MNEKPAAVNRRPHLSSSGGLGLLKTEFNGYRRTAYHDRIVSAFLPSGTFQKPKLRPQLPRAAALFCPRGIMNEVRPADQRGKSGPMDTGRNLRLLADF